MRNFFAVTAAALTFAVPAVADSLLIHDAYARVASPMARSGAVFMVIENSGVDADRLIGASTDLAERTELHTHVEDSAGVMRMIQIEGGIDLPAATRHELARGGDHVMLLGLTEAMAHGDTFALTLIFEQAGPVEVNVAVDLERAAAHEIMKDHQHGHGHSGVHGH